MLIAELNVSLLINCIMAKLSDLVLKVSFDFVNEMDVRGVHLDFIEPQSGDVVAHYLFTPGDDIFLNLTLVQGSFDKYDFFKNHDVDDLPF